MNDVKFDTSALTDLIGDFARADTIDQLADREAAEIAREAARVAVAAAPRRTGALAASIHADGSRIVAGADYAVFVEYGTSRQPPQPFMRPAGDKALILFEEKIAAEVADLLEIRGL